MSTQLINFWLCRFVLEIRRCDGEPLVVSDIRRHHYINCAVVFFTTDLRAAGRAEVNIFEQAEFHMFRTTLDSEMKRLSSTGQYM